jgi:hypothetical protein
MNVTENRIDGVSGILGLNVKIVIRTFISHISVKSIIPEVVAGNVIQSYVGLMLLSIIQGQILTSPGSTQNRNAAPAISERIATVSSYRNSQICQCSARIVIMIFILDSLLPGGKLIVLPAMKPLAGKPQGSITTMPLSGLMESI